MFTRKLVGYWREHGRQHRSTVAVVGALSAFTTAAFMWDTIPGVVMVGVSLLAADYLAD